MVQADVIIQGHDKTSEIFARISDNATAMQKQIEGRTKLAGPAFAEQIEKQMSGQAKLQDQLFRATSSQKDIALRDLKVYYDKQREQFSDNEQMITLITQVETAKRTQIMEQYAESSIATFARMRVAYIGMIRTFSIVAITLRGIEALTEAAVTLRDKGIGPAVEAFVGKIPLLGPMLISTGENIAELMMDTTSDIRKYRIEMELLAKQEKITNDILAMRATLTKDISLLRMAPALREQAAIQDKYNKIMEETLRMEAEARRIKAEAPGDVRLISTPAGTIEEYTSPKYLEAIKTLKEIERIRTQAGQERDIALEELRIEPIRRIQEQLRKQLDTYSMTRGELILYEAAREGATAAEMTAIAIQAQYLDKFDEENKKREEQISLIKRQEEAQQSFADSVKESIKTATQHYDDYIHKLHEAYIAGRLTREEYDRAQLTEYYKTFVGKGKEQGQDIRRELLARETGFQTRWPVTGAPKDYDSQIATNTKSQLTMTTEMAKTLKNIEKSLGTNKLELSPVGRN